MSNAPTCPHGTKTYADGYWLCPNAGTGADWVCAPEEPSITHPAPVVQGPAKTQTVGSGAPTGAPSRSGAAKRRPPTGAPRVRGDWRIRWRQTVMLAKRPNGRGLTMTALKAAVAISDSFADKPVPPPERGTWVSQDELVRRTGLYDRKEFKSGYRELVDAGLLRVLTGDQAEAHVRAAMGDAYDAARRPQNRTVYIPLLPNE